MKSIHAAALIIVVCGFQFASGCTDRQKTFSHIQVGMTKEEIVKTLGNPSKKAISKKSSKYIWGPEERFWDQIPMGTVYEVWSYQNRKGQLNLYFLENNNRVTFKAFAPKGVVYETKP